MTAAPTSTAEIPGATTSIDSPWPGLLAFRETDEGFFQGRKAETEELLRLVLRERLVVLFGKSGLGKSSLLQAGLFPRLRREQLLPVYIRLDFSADTPHLVAQVRSAIAREAALHDIEAPAAIEGETLWEYFHRAGHTFWTARNRPVTPLLVLDQFEEIFTVGRRDAGRNAAVGELLEQLADLAEGRTPAALKARLDAQPDGASAYDFGRHAYKLLISIREDFLPQLEALRARMPALGLIRMRLEQMNGEAARLVVQQVPQLIDADVAERVVRFVAADKGDHPLAELEVEPALLSLVCHELNVKRRERGERKITAALLEGSQEEVLADFYERSMADLPLPVREFVEDNLLTGKGYRDSAALEKALYTPGVTRDAIDRLVDRRLVRLEEWSGVLRLELTHDRLTDVVMASRKGRKARNAAAQVEEEQRAALRAAEDELVRQRENASQNRRALQRARAVAGLFLVLLLAALGAAGWAVRAQRLAQTALSRMTYALTAQLNSPDGSLAASAFEQLRQDRGVEGAMSLISDASLRSDEWTAGFVVSLERDRSAPESAGIRDSVQTLLRARLSTARGIGAPPLQPSKDSVNVGVWIAGGSFEMGSPDNVGLENEHPQHQVTVSPFVMQEHEVTNREYRRFDPSHGPGEPDDDPAVRVTWFEAAAYAAWLGGSLPTEAQWEFAARGAEGHTYPWGEESPDSSCQRANYAGCRPRELKAVKRGRDAGRTSDGVYDLAGNVWEWCRDWQGPYDAVAAKDPIGPPTGTWRVVRGGSFDFDANHLRGAFRGGYLPILDFARLGFRVIWPEAGDR